MNITTSINICPCFANDTHVILPFCCNDYLCDFKYVPCSIALMGVSFILGCNGIELAATTTQMILRDSALLLMEAVIKFNHHLKS
jgi:hypothetical protein